MYTLCAKCSWADGRFGIGLVSLRCVNTPGMIGMDKKMAVRLYRQNNVRALRFVGHSLPYVNMVLFLGTYWVCGGHVNRACAWRTQSG